MIHVYSGYENKECEEMNMNEQNLVVEKIRSQYTQKPVTRLDELKALDKKVKKPAVVFASVFGSISAIVMGCGMSLVMTELGKILRIGSPMILGVAIGVVGLAMALLCWPMYKAILKNRRKKYADRILALTDELMN